MSVTIKDVAKCAKVSPSTVSRVIADHPRISQDTKERVRVAMNQLGYYPNAIARSLVNKTSNTLGVVLSRSAEQAFLNPFFPEVIRGISSIANKHGYSLLLSTSQERKQEENECLDMLRQRRVEGVIILASHKEDHLIQTLAQENHPFVLIGRYQGDEPVCWVNNDNVAAAKQAVDYLIDQGHREIACLSGNLDLLVSYDRYQGYLSALGEAGIKVNPRLVAESDFSLEQGYIATCGLLDGDQPFSALFAVDDLLAIGAMRAIKERNLLVGQDIAVVGFNNTVLGSCVEPSLTSIQVPIYELGRCAVQMLIARLRGVGPQIDSQVLPAKLIVRESC